MWPVLSRVLAASLLACLAGCTDTTPTRAADPAAPTTSAYDGPVAVPTEVPPAEGRVVTSTPVIVTDDGTGAHLCFSSLTFGGGLAHPIVCDDAAVAGWDWARHGGEFTEEDGVRTGTYRLTGTFDGETFTVEEAGEPGPPSDDWDFEIPCPTPEGGWRVLDPSRSTQDDYLRATSFAQELDGFAMVAVSTSAGEPGPRNPMDTVVSVYVTGDPADAEAAVRDVWGGKLCVTQVERSAAELEDVQMRIVRLSLPGVTQVGGNLDNRMEVEVFHDDGRYQQWADHELGEGVVVVESNLQPVG